MKLRCVLLIRNSGKATNAEIVKKIKEEAKSRMKDIQRMCKKFTEGTVKFRYGDVGEYDQLKDFETDWIMYRRALCEVFDCEIKPLSLEYDGTLRPYYVRIELYLEGE